MPLTSPPNTRTHKTSIWCGSSLIAFSILLVLCYQYVDLPLAETLHRTRSDMSRQAAKAISTLGYALYPLLLFGVVWGFARYYLKHAALARASAFVWLSIASSGLLCDLLKVLCGRARPQLWFNQNDYGFHGMQLHAAHWSFPSGHSTTISATMVALWLVLGRFRAVSWAVIAIVCGSRLTVGAHYLSDVLAGCLLGSSSALCLYRLNYTKP